MHVLWPIGCTREDGDFARRLEDCEACIEGESCVEATFQRTADCVGISSK